MPTKALKAFSMMHRRLAADRMAHLVSQDFCDFCDARDDKKITHSCIPKCWVIRQETPFLVYALYDSFIGIILTELPHNFTSVLIFFRKYRVPNASSHLTEGVILLKHWILYLTKKERMENDDHY